VQDLTGSEQSRTAASSGRHAPFGSLESGTWRTYRRSPGFLDKEERKAAEYAFAYA
jgi:hypothetical protein